MPDETDPPRKFYALKPKEFERVNPSPAAGDAPDLRADPGIAGGTADRIDVRELARAASDGVPMLAGTNAPANRDNEVHAILRDNHAAAGAAGLNELTPQPRRRSKRKRHYWLLMIPPTIFFSTIVALTGPKQPLPFVLSLASLVLYNIGLWWVMWHVSEDY